MYTGEIEAGAKTGFIKYAYGFALAWAGCGLQIIFTIVYIPILLHAKSDSGYDVK